MTPIDITLSFVISLIAGNIPTIKELLSKNPTIDKAIRKCFQNAVDQWDVIDEFKNDIKNNPEKYFSDLKDYILNPSKGRHPKQNELLRLWVNEIQNNPTAASFLLQSRQEIELALSSEIKGLANTIYQEQQRIIEASKEIRDLVSPYRTDGVKTIKDYWENWSLGDGFSLHTDIVLSDRDDDISRIRNAVQHPQVCHVGASSVSEAIAFVCASLLLSDEFDSNKAIVITKENTYEKILATDPSGLVFVTDVRDNHNVATHKGNVVFYCEARQHVLPELSPSAFSSALEKSLSSNIESYSLARQGGYDVVSLRRILQIETKHPIWLSSENKDIIVKVSMLGGWNDNCKEDKEIIHNFTGLEYDEFISRISPLLKADNAPIIRIGNEWRVKSPLDLDSLILSEITDLHLDKLHEQLSFLAMDVDTEAVEKLEETEFRFHTYNQMISPSLKRGIYSSMTVLANMMESYDASKAERIKQMVADIFSSFDLEQYLSNRHSLIYLAAINPKSFLDFIIEDINHGGKLLTALFQGRKKDLSLMGYSINNGELLHVLECISLEGTYLYEVTFILLYSMKYPKVANYTDGVTDLLVKIFQFRVPQTSANFEERLHVLNDLKTTYPQGVLVVLGNMIDSIINPKPFMVSQGFPMKTYRLRTTTECIKEEYISEVISLLKEIFIPTVENYLMCLRFAMSPALGKYRDLFVEFLLMKSDNFLKNPQIIDELNHNIHNHEEYSTAKWALSPKELASIKSLYRILCSEDILLLSRRYFSNDLPLITKRGKHGDYIERERQSNVLRGEKIEEIVNLLGFDSLWRFATTVGKPTAIFEGLVTLNKSVYSKAVYRAFISDKIEEPQANVYFSRLYREIGETEYIGLIEELKVISKDRIAILLYAPSWRPAIANLAESFGNEVVLQYWEKVHIWHQPKDYNLKFVIHNLLKAKREWDIIALITEEEILKSINIELKIRVLKGAVINRQANHNQIDFYDFNKILLSIKDDEIHETEFEKEILEIEGFLFQTLTEHLNPNEELHIVRALKWNPNLMIELLKSYDQLNTKDSLIGFEVLYKFVNQVNFVICQHQDGSIDFDNVVNYISILIEYQELPLSYILIGNLLYKIMITQNEPSKEFCQVIETLGNDDVDQHLYLAISNSRGCTWRGCFDGGQQERTLADHYGELARKVMPYSYRLKNVFENLRTSYLAEAKRMDDEALRNMYR